MTLSIGYERLHKLCFLDRDHLFGRTINNVYLLDKFSNRLGDVDKDPFIGYFGNEYELQKKRVMFLGRSNAESASWGQDDDRQINKAFRIFRNSVNDHAKLYRNYADEYLQAMPKWNIYQNFVKYFLDNANLDIHKVAYANSVPFRYKGGPSIGAFEIAFENFTSELISIFKPDIIVPLGIHDDERLLQRFLPAEQLESIKICKGIKRTNGDNFRCSQGEELLDEAIEEFLKP